MQDDHIQAFYDGYVEHEWNRLERHKMEFTTTWRTMREYIVPGSRILDIGGGPGRYSIHLALAGHRVILSDLSASNVAFAKCKALEFKAPVDDFIQCDARDLSAFDDVVFDAVLLMGPLYHLLKADDRDQAIKEALRVLKPEGLLFTSFITIYAFVIAMLRIDPALIENYMPVVKGLINGRDGVITGRQSLSSMGGPGFTDAYNIHPSEVEPLMHRHGLTMLRIAAVEGIASIAANLPEDHFEPWADICYELGTDPTTWGMSEHLLYVGRKPGIKI